MKGSDNIRGADGVVISFLQLDGDSIRVFVDDVKNERAPAKGPWADRGVVTWRDFSLADFDGLGIPDEELASFGHYVFARLQASKKVPHR